MKSHTGSHGDSKKAQAFLWGAAHAFNFGGLLVDDCELGGLEMDARSLSGDWRSALGNANKAIDVSEASEKK